MDPPATDVKDLVATQIAIIQKILRDQRSFNTQLEDLAKELASLARALERGIFDE